MTTTAPDLLATIVAGTRRAVEHRASVCPIADLQKQVSRSPGGSAFVEALRAGAAPRVIAECKRRSPSKGILREHYDPAAHAKAYQDAGAAAISVLTEPTFFDGSLDHLRAVRAAVTIPILRKDFIVTEYQVHEAAASGADAILLIVGALPPDSRLPGDAWLPPSGGSVDLRHLLELATSLGLAALVEVHDEAELARAVAAGAEIIGVNSRNLRTLTVDHGVLERVAAEFFRLKAEATGSTSGGFRLPRPERSRGQAEGTGIDAVLVAESGIRSGEDMRRLSGAGYDAFLVGERLITQPDPGAALRELRTS